MAVLRRGSGEIQIGLDPRRAMVVGGLPTSVADAASTLGGGRTTAELLDSRHTEQWRALLTDLAGRGLVEDAAAPVTDLPRRLRADQTTASVRRVVSDPQDRVRATVAIHGRGRLSVAVACQLAAAGVGGILVHADGEVRAEDIGTGLAPDDIGKPRGPALRDAIRRVDDSVRTGGGPPDLAILTDALVPDPAIVADLFDRRIPHLPVRVRDGVGLVGPLVVPTVTACLTCADHHRTDRDPQWPMLAAQLVGRTQLADLPSANATAALATTQVLTVLRWLAESGPRLPKVWNRTLELDAVDGTIDHRPWPPHPECAWCRHPDDTARN